MSSESCVAREVAESEFDRFCEEMDLDVDLSKMDEDDRRGFERARSKIVRAIERGRLTVDDDGVPTYHYEPGGDSPAVEVRFPEPTGETFLAMDKGKRDHVMGRMVLIMSKHTGLPGTTLSKMPKRHFDVCTAIEQLFLG